MMRAINYNMPRAFRGAMRPLTLSDLDELWHLDLRCFVDGETYERDTFRFLLSNPNTISRQIRSIDDEMCAFGITIIESDGVGHITTIGVAPEHRRRGLARLLLHEIEKSLSAHHISTVRLEVRVSNYPAQRLYEQLGYVVIQRLLGYYSNGDDGYMMVKSL